MTTLVVGIDAGSRATKAVLLDADTRDVLASGTVDQSIDIDARTLELVDKLLAEVGLGRAAVAFTVSTGYGRKIVSMADKAVTEITCHGRGIHHVAPDARTVVEIGGQDSKVLRLGEEGTVRDFSMNDRCAAGTGRFLEVVATQLGLRLVEMGEVAAKSEHPARISSMCVVFAESEIISLLATGTPPADIIAGVQHAIASRVASMVRRRAEPPVVFTGGVALLGGMARALSAATGHDVRLAPTPQLTGALGAALLAADELVRARVEPAG